MKWTILGLVFVGLIAAFAATVLTAALRAQLGLGGAEIVTASAERPTEMKVIVAARALPAMAVVDASSVATRTIMSDEAPEGALTSPVQVIGQILLTPMQEGEPFSARKFPRGESRIHLAATLPQGGRAMSVVLADERGVEGLLYPGCLVDVVASFRMPAVRGSPAGEVVSVTLLQGVQVLSIGPDSVVGEQGQARIDPSKIEGRQRRVVTLLVNSDQAEALQLASAHGEISIVLRNPLDIDHVSSRGVLLSDLSEEIAQRLAALAAVPLSSEAMVAPLADVSEDGDAGAEEYAVNARPAPLPSEQPRVEAPPVPQWKIIVLRGRSSETHSFPLEDVEEVAGP